MRSRVGLFASTAALAFASVGGIAVATGSHGHPKPPTVETYEISHDVTNTYVKWVFFIFPVKYTETVSVEEQCKDQLDKASRKTSVELKWGPDKKYCWVTVTTKK